MPYIGLQGCCDTQAQSIHTFKWHFYGAHNRWLAACCCCMSLLLRLKMQTTGLCIIWTTTILKISCFECYLYIFSKWSYGQISDCFNENLNFSGDLMLAKFAMMACVDQMSLSQRMRKVGKTNFMWQSSYERVSSRDSIMHMYIPAILSKSLLKDRDKAALVSLLLFATSLFSANVVT